MNSLVVSSCVNVIYNSTYSTLPVNTTTQLPMLGHLFEIAAAC